jgi:hypothetical protein
MLSNIARVRVALLASLFISFSLPALASDANIALADKQAIAEVLAQYAYRWDSKDGDGFQALFTDDAVMERWRGGKLVEDSRVQGRSAIHGYADSSHSGRLADRQTRHHFSNLVFLELSENEAVTENMALITHQTASDPAARIASSGIYRISWEKTAGVWNISRRILFSDSAPAFE